MIPSRCRQLLLIIKEAELFFFVRVSTVRSFCWYARSDAQPLDDDVIPPAPTPTPTLTLTLTIPSLCPRPSHGLTQVRYAVLLFVPHAAIRPNS
jgi:hypothetical protein